ncbi:MAG: hypothetical protein M1825_001459, partial [Sarcosagium campestre]
MTGKTAFSQSSKSDENSYMEDGGRGGKVGLGHKLKNFVKRFWWLLLIIFVVCTLVIVLPLIYVGFPRIAQSGVNNSGLEITSMAITEPTESSFHLREDTVLTSDSIYHPTLDAFNASVALAGEDSDGKPFAYITIPSVAATKVANVLIDQDVKIADLDAFTKYTVKVMNSEEYQLAVSGRTGLSQTALKKIDVDYNKVVTMKGLNKLKGFDVLSTKLMTKPAADGSNLEGTVYIPNASVLTLAMGNLTLNLMVDGNMIGTSTIDNLLLKPGNNTVPMRSKADQSQVFKLLSKFPGGVIPIDVVGNSSVYNGQHLTYYEEALKSVTQKIQLNVTEALGGSLGGL